MKINRNNYEQYFMDYLDGNLSDQEIHMLEDFLLTNPDLRTELEGTERIVLSPDSNIYNQKEYLKKPDFTLPVNEFNFEDYCIAGIEGDLNNLQLAELNKYIQDYPETRKLFQLYTRLHLTPDKSIVFPGKGDLKKTIILVKREVIYTLLSIAAAVAFILIVYFRNENISNNIPGVTANLPAVNIAKPVVDSQDISNENIFVQKKIPVVHQASVIAFPSPKEKKQSPVNKAGEFTQKKKDENKNSDPLPSQKLNPSFEIKLPSVADNHISVPSIDPEKITYSTVKSTINSPEYLSLSEYARKQLTEKVLGNKAQENTRLTGWQIADVGISGINKLTGGEMKLEKKISQDGNLTAYSFNSKVLSFSRKIVK